MHYSRKDKTVKFKDQNEQYYLERDNISRGKPNIQNGQYHLERDNTSKGKPNKWVRYLTTRTTSRGKTQQMSALFEKGQKREGQGPKRIIPPQEEQYLERKLNKWVRYSTTFKRHFLRKNKTVRVKIQNKQYHLKRDNISREETQQVGA